MTAFKPALRALFLAAPHRDAAHAEPCGVRGWWPVVLFARTFVLPATELAFVSADSPSAGLTGSLAARREDPRYQGNAGVGYQPKRLQVPRHLSEVHRQGREDPEGLLAAGSPIP